MNDQTKTNLRNKIRERAFDNFDIGTFLQNNDTFDHGCFLADDEAVRRSANLLELLMEGTFTRHREWEQKKIDIEILCANLLVNKTSKPLAISLDRNQYVPNKNIRASYFVITLVRLMTDGKWIEQAKGNQKMKRMTRIWPTLKLIEYFAPYDETDFTPIELVNLHDANKKFINYDETPETEEIRIILRNANIVNRKSVVQLRTRTGFQKLNTDLYAVFNNSSFEQGGRLYTGKGGYQSLHKDERLDIWIDHEKTVELDFSSMQPRLLYAKEGIQYPLDADPYTAVIAEYPELRLFVKQLLLALMNAPSLSKAIAAGNHILFEDLHTKHGIKLFAAVEEIGISVAELVERFQRVHPDITKHFGTAIGLKLQRLDARIALEIIECFTSREIPILAIHDSFIVQERWKDDLRKVMTEAFVKHTKGFKCPIK